MRYKLGFLGAGVMAGAILDNVLINTSKLGIKAADVAVFDIDSGKVAAYAGKGATPVSTAEALFADCEIVLLGVKPQYYAEILAKIDNIACKTVVSIMAGVKTSTLRKALSNIGIVRVMPNMPCKIGEGMSALAFDKVDIGTTSFVKSVFDACGKAIIISEDKFDAVTSISGSGPAYVYMFIDGLVQGGIEGGLTPDESKALAIQTLIGAAKLAERDGTPLEVLVDRVCSKGGTTIEAVGYYKEAGLTDIVKVGVKRCRDKSRLLSDKL